MSRSTRPVRTFIAVSLSLILSNVPAVAAQVTVRGEMISTSSVVEQLTETESRQKVANYLKRDDVRQALAKRGLSESEITTRLASLSHKEMQQLQTQLDQAKYGGDVLVTVLLVVLIIFLIQRI
ncbi:MAG: PA2779 family protein [Bdellovibrionota bacterium]